jgi:hypothetical protein
MLHVNKLFVNERLCKAMTGMSSKEFQALVPGFSQVLTEYRYTLRPLRKRKVGGGQKGKLPTVEDKLAFILMYLKIYPTYDVLGFFVDRDRGKCCRSVQLLLPVLEQTLGRTLALPERKTHSLKEVFERFPELKDVFVDGTERRVQKPKGLKKRNKLYSGKKKATTRKTVIVSDEKKRILYMSKTKSGRRHDKRLADKAHLFTTIPPDVAVWTDTGFQGAQKQHRNIVMPLKASKKHPLTLEQKENNRVVSSFRVVSEHAIGGFKRFKAAADVYRNRLPNLDDLMTEVACGLWNFHLVQTA